MPNPTVPLFFLLLFGTADIAFSQAQELAYCPVQFRSEGASGSQDAGYPQADSGERQRDPDGFAFRNLMDIDEYHIPAVALAAAFGGWDQVRGELLSLFPDSRELRRYLASFTLSVGNVCPSHMLEIMRRASQGDDSSWEAAIYAFIEYEEGPFSRAPGSSPRVSQGLLQDTQRTGETATDVGLLQILSAMITPAIEVAPPVGYQIYSTEGLEDGRRMAQAIGCEQAFPVHQNIARYVIDLLSSDTPSYPHDRANQMSLLFFSNLRTSPQLQGFKEEQIRASQIIQDVYSDSRVENYFEHLFAQEREAAARARGALSAAEIIAGDEVLGLFCLLEGFENRWLSEYLNAIAIPNSPAARELLRLSRMRDNGLPRLFSVYSSTGGEMGGTVPFDPNTNGRWPMCEGSRFTEKPLFVVFRQNAVGGWRIDRQISLEPIFRATDPERQIGWCPNYSVVTVEDTSPSLNMGPSP